MLESTELVVDKERIVQMVNRALEGREKREGIFKMLITPPEKPLIDISQKYAQTHGLVNFPLHTIFFTCMTLFMDNSTRQLKRISRPALFYPYAWLFQPENVAQRGRGEVFQAAQDLIRPGYNISALDRWQHNARVLTQYYDGNLVNFFSAHNFDAPAILDDLVGPKRKKEWEGLHRFGPKLGRLFLQWVGQYDLAQKKGGTVQLKRISDIGVPVDFQVARLVIQTGGLHLPKPTHKHWVLDKTLTPLFTTLCQDQNLPPRVVSETLWLIGNRCCNNLRHSLCPLEKMCNRLISRNPMDSDGLFDPRDSGRWLTPQKLVLV